MSILEHNGIRIDYQEAGQGETVILIHCSASGYGQWRKLMEALAPQFRVVAYNRYGCGETSPWPASRPQTLADQAELALALARRSGERVHLVGHSFGASIAMKTALALGDRVASLTLLEPNPFHLLQQHGRHEAYAESRALRDLVKTHGAAGNWEKAAEGFADFWIAPGAYAAMTPERRQAFAKTLPSNYHEWDCMAEESSVEEWRPLAARTLLVTARDTVRPIREIADILREHLADLSWQQVPAGGHMAPVTRAGEINPLVIAHVERFAG